MHSTYDLERAITPELEYGEDLLWVGRPDPRRAMFQMAGCLVFAVPWTAFSLSWTWLAFTTGRGTPGPVGFDWLFPLFGLPFVAIGIGMLLSPLWAHRTAGRTLHAVTDRRILTVVEGSTRQVTSWLPRDIGNLKRTERADGSGDLVFAKRVTQGSNGRSRSSPQGLFGIQEVRRVDMLVREGLLKQGRNLAAKDETDRS